MHLPQVYEPGVRDRDTPSSIDVTRDVVDGLVDKEMQTHHNGERDVYYDPRTPRLAPKAPQLAPRVRPSDSDQNVDVIVGGHDIHQIMDPVTIIGMDAVTDGDRVINSPRAPAGNIVPHQVSTNIEGVLRGGNLATQDLVALPAWQVILHENRVDKDNGPGGDADTNVYRQYQDNQSPNDSPPRRTQDASNSSGNYYFPDSSSAHSQANQTMLQG